MSKKATNVSRDVNRALARSGRNSGEVRAASRAARMARDARRAAVSAACAAERTGSGNTSGQPSRLASARGIAAQVEDAANEAVERAKDAMMAEDAGDVIAAIVAANLAAKAAQRASSLAAAAEIVVGKDQPQAPSLSDLEAGIDREDRKAAAEAEERALSAKIDRGARYLVYRNGLLLASFLREDDALLFEAELAELDVARRVDGATCEVRDRGRARNSGGYVLAGGQLASYVWDEARERS